MVQRLHSRLATATLTAMLLTNATPLLAQQGPVPGARTKGGNAAAVQPAPGLDYVEIVTEGGTRSRVIFSAIKKASSGPIQRGGDRFDFTPLTAVMKLAGIASATQIRVSGTAQNSKGGREMILRAGSTYDPAEFGFIFNRRERPVLTPRPGSKHAAPPVTSDRPQVIDVTTLTVLAR